MKKKSNKKATENAKKKMVVIFDSTKNKEYKGAHSIGCKN